MTAAAGALAILMLTMPAGPADPPSDDPPCPSTSHVRAVTAAVQSLLDRAAATSGTVRDLLARLGQTDTIVYVELMPNARSPLARTKLVTASGQARFLRIGISFAVPFPDLTPVIAHELQHAVEIAERPEVRDDEALRRLYAEIGRQVGGDMFETNAAQDVERRVRGEVRRK